jgi:hypothetical protein
MSKLSHALKLYAAFKIESSKFRGGVVIDAYTPTDSDHAAAMLASINDEATLRAAVVMAGLLATKPKEAATKPTKPAPFGRDPFNPNDNPPPRYA